MVQIRNLRELIKDMPEVIQPLAELYVDVLERWTSERIDQWVRTALLGGWVSARSVLISSMTNDELKIECKRRVNAMYSLNADNAIFIQAQQTAIIEILINILVQA